MDDDGFSAVALFIVGVQLLLFVAAMFVAIHFIIKFW